MTRTELELNSYVHHLEEHLQLTVFGRGVADPEAAVLLVRGALAAGDRAGAVELAAATTRLTAQWPDDRDMAAAAAHVQGLVEQDPAALESAGQRYSTPVGKAWAAEDAGVALAQRGDQAGAVARLHDAYDRYGQLGATDSMARVRSRLRATGVRLQPGRRSGRPAFGWDSLTETEQRIAHLVAEGLTNRQIASKMFLSSHTVAFHLRRIFCKLDVVSRVQVASLAADKARAAD
jgi:DNA-binding CsgD family transcriptional regulator